MNADCNVMTINLLIDTDLEADEGLDDAVHGLDHEPLGHAVAYAETEWVDACE